MVVTLYCTKFIKGVLSIFAVRTSMSKNATKNNLLKCPHKFPAIGP
jgi:hypothetical protein